MPNTQTTTAPAPTPAPAGSNASKLYQMLSTGEAPAHVGKPVFAKDLEIAKLYGARTFQDVFGHHDQPQNKAVSASLNFGSKASVGGMPEETRMRLFNLKRLFSDVEIQAGVMFKTVRPSVDEMMATPLYKERLEPLLKAFDLATFATWAPTVNARFYFEEYEIALLLADLFDQMPMTSLTEKVNGAMGRLFGRLETDTATFGEQSNTSDSYDVTAKNNVVHTKISEDLNQDSAPAIIDKLRKEVMKGIGRSEERTILDGDITGTHMDADVTVSTDFRKAFPGLRKKALANSANGVVIDHGGDVASKALFRKMLKAAGKWGTDKGDLRWILGPAVGTDLVSGAIPELSTAFAFGSVASTRTGVVPPVFGIQGVESEFVREDLASTGVYTDGTDTLTYMLLVKLSAFQRWLRAPVRVWAGPSLPSSDFMLMSAKKRHTFGGNPQGANEKSVIIGINIEADGDEA